MPDPRDVVANIYVEFANELADAAAAAIRPWFRAALTVDRKADGSPVTRADRDAESAIRERIAQRFPSHGVVGEEWGSEQSGAEWVWVIDPIDGTGAFVSGVPTFGTLIGLLHEGVPVLGVLDQPISNERWIGVTWSGLPRRATLNTHTIHVASTAIIHTAIGFATSPEQFEGADLQAWNRLSGELQRVRYGIDCYAYGLLASGYVDLVAEASLKPWDCLPLVPIVRGAGGMISDWTGAPLSLDNAEHALATATPQLHAAAITALADPLTR